MNPKPDMKIPALYGGIIIGLISSIPFLSFINCFCCAGILLGGFLAVMFYTKNFTPDTPPFTAGDCIAVGVFAGIIGAVVETFLSIAFVAMFGNVTVEFLLNFLRNSNIQIPDEAMEKLEEALQQSRSVVTIMTNFFFAMMINALFGLLGGLIGYSVFKPKQSQVMPPPPPAPVVQ
jgi:hypothetical protein